MIRFELRAIPGTPYTDVAVWCMNTSVDLGFLAPDDAASLAAELEAAAEYLRDRMKAIRKWEEREM